MDQCSSVCDGQARDSGFSSSLKGNGTIFRCLDSMGLAWWFRPYSAIVTMDFGLALQIVAFIGFTEISRSTSAVLMAFRAIRCKASLRIAKEISGSPLLGESIVFTKPRWLATRSAKL